MRITVGAPKGGAGKTTTAGHLAVLMASSGRTLGLDCDPEQPSLKKWADRAEDWPVERCNIVREASRNLARNISPMVGDYANVIFDIGAKNPVLLRQAMSLSDILIVPSKATDGDLLELQEVFEIAAEVDATHAIRPVVLLTMIRGGTNEEKDARAYLAELGLPVFETAIPVLRQYGQMRYAPAVDEGGEYADLYAELVAMHQGLGVAQ